MYELGIKNQYEYHFIFKKVDETLIEVANEDKVISDKEIGRYDIEIPMLEIGDEFFLHDIQELVKIKSRTRSSDGSITYYIDDKIIEEGLLSWFKAFFKKIYNMQRNRIKNNKVEMYDVDTEQLKVQKDSIKLLEVDKETIAMWNDKKVGFPTLR